MEKGVVALYASLYLSSGVCLNDRSSDRPAEKTDAAGYALSCEEHQADAVLVYDLSTTDEEHELSIGALRRMTAAVDLPILGGGNIRRLEDVKKLLYAGCRAVFLNYAKKSNRELTREASMRFGREKLMAWLPQGTVPEPEEAELLSGILTDAATAVLAAEAFPELSVIVTENCGAQALQTEPVVLSANGQQRTFRSIAGLGTVAGMADSGWDSGTEFQQLRKQLKDAGIPVKELVSSVTWDEVKTGSDGLLPVVVQDYRTEEVLMVAYMNREAFEETLRSGRMTYWSRSRQELWVKGLTSGHFQYVKELRIDCDNDTLLAKVRQVGAACHTGNRSCFYRSIWKKEYDDTNPATVFQDVMDVILDRREHPKEGSYTNYLFDKGIDKILKKVGEEATEIVIAAKNPDPEETKYEISDFLYHVMVLMVEKGLRWDDITGELRKR